MLISLHIENNGEILYTQIFSLRLLNIYISRETRIYEYSNYVIRLAALTIGARPNIYLLI